MLRFSRHDIFFISTLIIVMALLLSVRAVPTAIGQWMLYQAADFVYMWLLGPLILLSMAASPHAFPAWVRKLLAGVVVWAMMCGAVIIAELRLPSEGQVVGVMAVIFAIAIPWMVTSKTA